MTSAPKTVLIVDDDKLILATYEYAFKRRGHRVLLAENGNIALAHLEKVPVDVMFLDILMPEKEGLETLIEIKRRFPDVAVYAMSGGGGRNKHDFLSIAKKFGATGTIRKPVTTTELIRLVEQPLPKHAAAKTESGA